MLTHRACAFLLLQITAVIDKLMGVERYSVAAGTRRRNLSVQYRYWRAVEENMECLTPILERIKNRVEKEAATAKGKTFDETLQPTDARFIGRQVDDVG